MNDAEVKKILEQAFIAVLNLKEEYIAIQDFNNAAKWRDVGDVIKKANLMAAKPVKIETDTSK